MDVVNNTNNNNNDVVIEENLEKNVIIVVGEEGSERKAFETNSNVLKEKSSYFNAALSSNWARIQDDKYYFEKPNISQNGIPWLCENVVRVYSAAYGNQSITELQELCVKLICEQPNILFKSKDFPYTNKLALINIVQRSDLNTHELQIWKSIINWGV